MEKATNILRTSIHSLFTSYDIFASIATLLILPSSASTLLLPPPNTSSPSSTLLHFISIQKPQLSIIPYPKFAHTILSLFLTLPFTLTFLPLAKASIILASREPHRHNQSPPPVSSFLHLYRPLALAQLFNTFLTLSTNAILLIILFLLSNSTKLFSIDSTAIVVLISVVSIVLYTTITLYIAAICNLSSIISAMENCRADEALMKSSVLLRGRAAIALSLAAPTDLAMAAIELVFQARVMKPYFQNNKFDLSLICEGFTITYMYSIITVLHIIITCCFYKFCKHDSLGNCEGQFGYGQELREEEKGIIVNKFKGEEGYYANIIF
ncbi:uncharacterized protein LOC110031268 [Phalaenopsis equestris]|uniref:uncharacterized protein LOC110031268 n=1 Tax=Phalaenopsis equestris TaxID=78828 RepID=UPI0009E1C1D8|nr:uncharacterized protein LOC110031268 [Phalaenopsis equestris]